MNRIPPGLDLSNVIGLTIPRLDVGHLDIHFALGSTHFSVFSQISLRRRGRAIGSWRPGTWPPAIFLEIMNVAVSCCAQRADGTLDIELANGISIQLSDESEKLPAFAIWFAQGAEWLA